MHWWGEEGEFGLRSLFKGDSRLRKGKKRKAQVRVGGGQDWESRVFAKRDRANPGRK